MGKTRLFPKELRSPELLTDGQAEDLKLVLEAFRAAFVVLDDILPSCPAKNRAIAQLSQAKLIADEVVKFHTSRLTFARLASMFAAVEVHDKRVTHVVLNAFDFADLRAADSEKDLDHFGDRHNLAIGHVASCWNAIICVSRFVPKGRAVVIPEDEKFEMVKDWKPSFEKLIRI